MQITITIKEDGEVATETKVTGAAETAGGASFDAGAAPAALEGEEIEPALEASTIGQSSEEGAFEGSAAPVVVDEFGPPSSEPPFMGEIFEGDAFDAGAAPEALEDEEMSFEMAPISEVHITMNGGNPPA